MGLFSSECSNCGSTDHASGDCPNGGCFITTATLLSIGKTDNCRELNTFRNFRDNWLINQSDGQELIMKCYKVAPHIVCAINSTSNSRKIYREIWKKNLEYCLNLINQNRFKEAKLAYCNLIANLKQKYLKKEE